MSSIRSLGFILAVAGLVVAGGGAAFSGSAIPVIGTATQGVEASPTCDNNVMQSIELRAWMEGEREIVQNANLIGKSDSILEYSCFKSALDNTARDQGFFSEGLGTTSMDTALQRVVGTAWASYRNDNFSHNLLGGRLAIGPEPVTPVSGAPYRCAVMNLVWEQAKCQNFQSAGAPQDGFSILWDYVSQPDKRTLPTQCNKDDRWAPAFDAVYPEPPWMPPDWLAQARPQYLDFLGAGGGCAAPVVRTGLTVKLVNGRVFPDAVCATPGCWYNGSGCN